MSKLLFLTSTVSPSSIAFCGSVEQRRREYIKAVEFYLSNTSYRILIVDNSGYDFSHDFPNEKRLEALSFTECRPTTKGKGYAESLLMQYGFLHSKFIQEATQIIKITGRHIIKNINKQIFFCTDENAVYADSMINFFNARSYFFLAPKEFFLSWFFGRVEELNDDKGFYFEHLLANCIKQWRMVGGKYHELVLPVYIIGHPGGSSELYHAPSFKRYFVIFCKYIIVELMNLFHVGR